MEDRKKYVQKIKAVMEKDGDKVSLEDAEKIADNIEQLAKLLYETTAEEMKREKKLREHPKGFHLEGRYTCQICSAPITDQETWYDKYGIKCLLCQNAINKKIIPGMVATNKDSWYSAYDFESNFGVDRHALNRLVKLGVLKPRVVLNSLGKPHVRIFLLKDNRNALPPKNVVESRIVKGKDKDGKEWFSTKPWYRFVDPIKTLEKYEIGKYLSWKQK